MNFLPLPADDKAADFSAEQPLVLIYSREADTRFLFRTLLEIWNYRVIEAANFEDSIFAVEDKKPNLVLMDTSISLIDNLTMMRRMRESKAFGDNSNSGGGSDIPFILLSGHSQEKFRRMAMALGANDFLVKPVDFDLLELSLKKNIKTDFRGGV